MKKLLADAFATIRHKYQVDSEPGGHDEHHKSNTNQQEPVDLVELARQQLFMPRAESERSTTYKRCKHAQTQFLAKERLDKGCEQRNRAAEAWARSVRKSTNHRERTGEKYTDNSSTSSERSSYKELRHREREDKSHNEGDPNNRGRQPHRVDGAGEPAGGSSGSSSSSTTCDKSRRPHHNKRERSESSSNRSRHRPDHGHAMDARHTRSPTYLRDDIPVNNLRVTEDPHAEFIEDQLRIIRKAIHRRVGKEQPEIPALKGLKNVPSPEKEKYSGKDDAELFMSWLKQLLRWMEISRMVGPELDNTRVGLLGLFISDAAREWYVETIDNVPGSGIEWSFSDAICTMYHRFIHKSTAHAAAEQFNSVKYDAEGGVSALWESLIKWARKMPHWPDDYTFN